MKSYSYAIYSTNKNKKVRKFLLFYLAVRKIVCTFAEDLAALGNLRSGLSLRSLAKSLQKI